MTECEHGFTDPANCWKCRQNTRAATDIAKPAEPSKHTGRPHRIEIAVRFKCAWCGFKREKLSYIEDAARTKRVDVDADAHRVCDQCAVKLTTTNTNYRTD
jgi:hypothetical protein